MKPRGGHIGIVAVSAEGAALCYRTIAAEGCAAFGRHGHPRMTMHTRPLCDYMALMDAGDWDGVAALLQESASVLEQAGADLLICPDNTVHRVFDVVTRDSRVPWLHIAREVAAVAATAHHRRVALVGTRALMESSVYQDALSARGIETVVPGADDRARLDTIIFDELVYGIVHASTRAAIGDIIARLPCDAVALACTEIPLAVDGARTGVPILDSTRILARAALRHAADPTDGERLALQSTGTRDP